jgi:hypothetical protein
MSNGEKIQTSDLDDLSNEIKSENVQQAGYAPTSDELFGKGTFDTRVYSEAEKEELVDKGFELSQAHQDNFNYNEVMADLQGGGEQFWRAVKGSIYKGGLDVLENIGYLADVEQWGRAGDDFEKGYSNWLSEFASQEKKEFDEENPIFSAGTGDLGWWMQGLQSVGQSAIGFAVPGGIIGKTAGRAAKLANQFMKASKGLETGAAQVLTAFGTNYLESMMMSEEVYNNLYNNAIASGRTHEDAQSIAAKNAEEFRAKAKIGVITDAIAVGNLINGKGLISGAAQKNLKEKTLSVAKQMGTEAFEEGAMGFVQKEAERKGAIDIDPKKADNSGIVERMGNYATSPEGFTEMFFGALGGPLQTGGAAIVGKGIEKTGIGRLTDPGEFKKEAPEFTFDEPRPDVSFDATQKDIDAWEERKAKAEAKYKAEQDRYNKEQAEHSDKQAKFAEQEKYKNTGTIAQTKQEVDEFMNREAELLEDYKKAVILGDETAMRDIEDKRFENLFLRHAKSETARESEGSLERQLEAYASNPELDQDQRAMAKRYLDKIPEYQQTYNKLMGQYNSDVSTVETAFKIKARLESSNEMLEDINNRLNESEAELARSIKETEGISASPAQIEAISLQKEQRVLEKIKSSQKAEFNPKLQKELERRIKDYENRINVLNETVKDEPVASKVSTSVINANHNMQKVEKLANDKAQAFTAYTTYNGLNNYIENGNFKRDVEKDNLRFFNDKLNAADTEQELVEALYLLSATAIPANKKEDAIKRWTDKKDKIQEEQEQQTIDFENALEKYNQLSKLNEQIQSKKMSYLGKLSGIKRKETKLKEETLDVPAEVSLKEIIKATESAEETQKAIKDLEAERTFAKIEFDNITRFSKNLVKELSKAEEKVNGYNSLPGMSSFEEDLKKAADPETEKLTSTQVNTFAQTTEDADLSTSATQLKTEEAKIKNTDPELIPVSDYKNGASKPPVSKKFNDEQGSPVGLYKNIAYLTHSDRSTDKESNFANWLETTPDQDKIGTSLQFEIHKKDSDDLGLDYNDPSRVAIRIYPINKDGHKINFEGKPTYGFLRDTDPKYGEEGLIWIKEARNVLAKAKEEGWLNKLKPSITAVGSGILKSDTSGNTKNDIRDKLDKTGEEIVLAMFDGDEFKWGKGRTYSFGAVTGGTKGFIYASINDANGKRFPLKMNSRKLNTAEAEALYQTVLSTGQLRKSNKETVKNIAGVNGITYKQLMDLLVYNGEYSEKTNTPLHLNFKTKQLVIAGKAIPFTKISENEDLLKDYFLKMWRTTNSKMLNTSFNDPDSDFSGDFEWFGKEISFDSSYNDFQFDNGALTTNATFPNNRAFIQPWVEMSNPNTWGQKPSTIDTKKNTEKRTTVNKIIRDVPEDKNFGNIEGNAPDGVPTVSGIFAKSSKPVEAPSPDPRYDEGPDRFATDPPLPPSMQEKKTGQTGVTPKGTEALEAEKNKAEPAPPSKTVPEKRVKKVRRKPPETSKYNKLKDDFSMWKEFIELVNLKDELAWLNKELPYLSSEVRKGLIRVPGGVAEGILYNGVIILSDLANKGVTYHEAFHAVSKMYTDDVTRKKLYAEASEIYGKLDENGNPKTDGDYEEDLAKGFREYMINKGELKLPKLVKWLYDLVLDLVNVFRNNRMKLFSKIRAGRFDYKPVTGSGSTLASKLPFPSDFIDEAVKGMTYLIFKYSGVRSMDRDVDSIGEQELYDAVFFHIQDEYEAAFDEGNYSVSDHLDNILDEDYWPSFLALAKDEVMSYGFDIRKDDLETSETEDLVDGRLNIENAVHSSIKSSATNNTKLMVSMLRAAENTKDGVEGEGSKWFGKTLPRLADRTKSWRLLEQGLAGIIDYSDTKGTELKAPEQMLSAIKEMAKTYPPFNELVAQLESDKVPLYKKTQFYKTFSKTNIEYLMTVGTDTVDDKGKKTGIEWSVGSADVQSHANTIRSGWVESFVFNSVDDNGKLLNKENLKKTVQEFKEYRDAVKKLKSADSDILKRASGKMKELLNNVGLEVSEKTVNSFIESQKTQIPLKKLQFAISNIHSLFAPKNVNKEMSVSLQRMLKADYVYDEKENFINDNSVALRLASLEALDTDLPGERMVYGADGKAYFTVSQNNFLSKQMGRYKSNVKYLDDMLSSTYHNKSKWMMEMKKEFLLEDEGLLDKFKIKAFLLNKYDNKSSTSTEMETPDEITDRMVKTMGGSVSGGKSIFTPLTMADKSMMYQFEGFAFRKYNMASASAPVSKRALDQFYDYALAEIERISTVKQTGGTLDWYSSKGGLQSMWFPDLSFGTETAVNIGLYNEDGTLNIINPDVKLEVQKIVAKSIKDIIRKEYEYLIDNNINTMDDIIGLSESIKKEYGVTKSNYARSKTNKDDQFRNSKYHLIADYTLNSLTANIEFTMMFTGDPAFYKDLSKRTPFTIATGDDMMLVKDVPSTFNLAVIKDLERPSLLLGSNEAGKETGYYKEFKDRGIDTDVLSPYTKINLGDAQGYATPKRFRDIMRGLGKWNDALHDPIYNRLNDPAQFKPEDLIDMQNLMREDGVPSGQPLKGMHGELRKDGDIMVPTYVKYSLAPLWPAVIKGTNLEALARSMGENVDEVVFQSGIKAGAKDITEAKDLFENGSDIELKPFPLHNFYYKLQQDLPAKYDKKEKTLRASQPPKNITANTEGKMIEFQGEIIEGNEAVRLVHETESLLSDIGRQEFEEEFGVKGNKITDKETFYNSMVDKFVRDKVSNNLIEQLRSSDTPFDAIFQFADKLDSELHSKITKKTVKLEAQGGAFIQMSSAGFLKHSKISDLSQLPIKDRNGILHLTDVKGGLLGPRRENGKTKSGQIYLPFKAVENIPDLKERIEGGKLTGEKLKALLGDTITGFVGYRIPNQGLSSIDTLEIAGILPPHMGDTIVTYDEVPAKTGADFDIDKMYVMMPHTRWNNKEGILEKVPSGTDSKKALENRRLELWNAILTAEDSFIELVMPLDSDWLRDDAYYIALLEDIRKGNVNLKDLGHDTIESFIADSGRKAKANKYFKTKRLSNLEFASPGYQIELKKRNVAGKVGVGQTANHLSHHPQCQYKKLELLLDLGLGNRTAEGNIDLSGKTIKGSKLQITQAVSAWLNAYVDNAKDPYISLINNNTKTANAVFMLLRAGVNPDIVNRFVSQPIIKKYVENQFLSESKVLPKKFESYITHTVSETGEIISVDKSNSALDAFTVTAREFNMTPGNFEEISLSEYSEKELEQFILNPGEEQAAMLNTFLKYTFYARKLNEAVRATKADTEGTYGTSADNLAARELIRKVKDEGFVKGFERLFENTFIGAYDKNATQFSNDVFGSILLSKSQTVQATVKTISEMQGSEYTVNTELINKVIKAMRSFMYSGFESLNTSDTKLKELLDSKSGLGSELLRLKDIMPGDPLVQALGIKKISSTITTITMPSSKHKDQAESDRLWMAWEKMFDTSSEESTGNVEIAEGRKVADFAKDLVRMSFSTSGFQKNINSFYDLVPHTFMRGDFGEDNFNTFIKSLLDDSKNGDINELFIDQFYRHNSEDEKIVPKFEMSGKLKKLFKPVGASISNSGFKIAGDEAPSKMTASSKGGYSTLKPYVSIKTAVTEKPVTYRTDLFKYAGYKDGEYYYQAVTKLGLKETGNVIVEYDTDKSAVSAINPLRKGFEFGVLASLDENEVSGNMTDYQEDGIGEIRSAGDDYYTIDGIDNSSFEIKPVTVNKQKKYAMFARTPYNNLRQVAKEADTKEQALSNGTNKLKSMGSRRIERTLKNIC